LTSKERIAKAAGKYICNKCKNPDVNESTLQRHNLPNSLPDNNLPGVIISESKQTSIQALKRGDIMIDPHGGEFYVHSTRTNRRYTGVEVHGCRLEHLRDIADNKKFSTWKFKGVQRDVKVVSAASTTLQNRYEAAWRASEDEKYKRERGQMDTIAPDWKRDDASRRGGYMTIKAQDGKTYKAGDIVDVAWSNGTAPAILGNLDGTLYNQAGEVAVLSIQGIGWGKAKARFLPPKYITGKASNADRYNAQELLDKARGNKAASDVRRVQRKDMRRSMWGFE
jgi:hypothetical protein